VAWGWEHRATKKTPVWNQKEDTALPNYLWKMVLNKVYSIVRGGQEKGRNKAITVDDLFGLLCQSKANGVEASVAFGEHRAIASYLLQLARA